MAAQKNAIFLLALIASLGHFSASLAVAEYERSEEVEQGYYETEGFQEILRKLQEKYPKLRLHRRSPGEVGRKVNITLDGSDYVMETVGVEPPIFQISNYLTHEECDHIVKLAEEKGLDTSRTIGEMGDDILTDLTSEPTTLFESWDRDADGKINIQEVKEVLNSVFDIFLDEDFTIKVLEFYKLDSNFDGIITRAEFEEFNFENASVSLMEYVRKVKEDHPEIKSRHSLQTFLNPADYTTDEILHKLQRRLIQLTRLPDEIVNSSEEMQVVKYGPGGHYNCHTDSSEIGSQEESRPCCHLYSATEDCIPCRYVTVLYFLNDVEAGGETAFPVADNKTLVTQAIDDGRDGICDLARNCRQSNVVVTPEKGKAILWYNHQLTKSGWLGPLDLRSHHGGCDVIKGHKWIANNWISLSPYRTEDIKNWAIWMYNEKYPSQGNRGEEGGENEALDELESERSDNIRHNEL